MAAYASLLALARTLHKILNLDRYNNTLDKEKIVSLLEKVDFSVNFLEDYSEKHGGTADRVGNEMRKAAYEAQDFVDSYLYLVSRTDFDSSSSEACNEVSVDQDLNLALERINFFWEEAMKIKNSDTTEDLRPISYSSPVDHSSTVKITAKNMVVGFDDDLNSIKERLYEDSDELQIIPIGKTTLARRAYDDSLLKSDLQALETVINFSFTEECIEILVNLKRLKVDFDMYDDNWDDLKLNNLFRLQKLEELQVTVHRHNRSMIWNHAFPNSLKKLNLQGVSLTWENMTIIGSLPNLQVLEMMYIRAPEFSKWMPMEGEFLRLKYFCCSLDNLIKWEVEKEHFPRLDIVIVHVDMIVQCLAIMKYIY